jgi:hypothetical protein
MPILVLLIMVLNKLITKPSVFINRDMISYKRLRAFYSLLSSSNQTSLSFILFFTIFTGKIANFRTLADANILVGTGNNKNHHFHKIPILNDEKLQVKQEGSDTT